MRDEEVDLFEITHRVCDVCAMNGYVSGACRLVGPSATGQFAVLIVFGVCLSPHSSAARRRE